MGFPRHMSLYWMFSNCMICKALALAALEGWPSRGKVHGELVETRRGSGFVHAWLCQLTAAGTHQHQSVADLACPLQGEGETKCVAACRRKLQEMPKGTPITVISFDTDMLFMLLCFSCEANIRWVAKPGKAATLQHIVKVFIIDEMQDAGMPGLLTHEPAHAATVEGTQPRRGAYLATLVNTFCQVRLVTSGQWLSACEITGNGCSPYQQCSCRTWQCLDRSFAGTTYFLWCHHVPRRQYFSPGTIARPFKDSSRPQLDPSTFGPPSSIDAAGGSTCTCAPPWDHGEGRCSTCLRMTHAATMLGRSLFF